MTQRQLATAANISHAYVHQIETDQLKQRPSDQVMSSLARALGVPVSDLFEISGIPINEPSRSPDVFAANSGDLTDEEWGKLTEYAKFIKGQRQGG